MNSFIMDCTTFSTILLFKGDGVAKQTTRSVPTRTTAGLNPDHGRLLSLGRQLSRKRGRPTGHGKNLRVPNLKFCQKPNTRVYQKPTVGTFPTIEKTTQWPNCTVTTIKTVTAVTPTKANGHSGQAMDQKK